MEDKLDICKFLGLLPNECALVDEKLSVIITIADMRRLRLLYHLRSQLLMGPLNHQGT